MFYDKEKKDNLTIRFVLYDKLWRNLIPHCMLTTVVSVLVRYNILELADQLDLLYVCNLKDIFLFNIFCFIVVVMCEDINQINLHNDTFCVYEYNWDGLCNCKLIHVVGIA